MRGGTLLALGLILLIGGIISHEKIKSAEVLEWLPLAFFALYLSSYGKKIVQICFLNCDRSMLYYPFYRQKEVILNGLFYRLKKTFMYNVLCSIEIFAIFVGIILIGGTDRPLYVGFLSFLTIFSLTLLFSFHELFVYYLLQPFTSTLKVVNPMYKTISGGMYFVAYMQMKLSNEYKGHIEFYAYFVSLVAILYVAIGAFIIYKKAPQTFRIKD